MDAFNIACEEAYWEMKYRTPQGNSIILSFPTDVPIRDVQEIGNSNLEAAKSESGLRNFSSYFFVKNSSINSIKVVFDMADSANYDDIANMINYAYEEAYLKLKNDQQKA